MVIDGGQLLGDAAPVPAGGPSSVSSVGRRRHRHRGREPLVRHARHRRAGPLTFDRIGLGQSNLTYLVRDAGGRQMGAPAPAARTPAGVGPRRRPRDADPRRARGRPPSRPRGCSGSPTTRQVTDVPLLLMEFVDGMSSTDVEVAAALTPDVARADRPVAAPRRSRRCTRSTSAATGLARPGQPRAVRAAAAQAVAAAVGDVADPRAARRRGADRPARTPRCPSSGELTLVHGDFHLRQRHRVPGGDGDARSSTGSCARSATRSPTSAACSPTGRSRATPRTGTFPASALDGFPAPGGAGRGVRRRDRPRPAALPFWHALGLWKVAIICEGVLRRARDEPQNKAAAGTPTVERIDDLVAKACDIAARAGI